MNMTYLPVKWLRSVDFNYNFVSFFCIFLVVSCTIRLIAPYDEVTDLKAAELQEKIALTFKKWERELPEFKDSHDFYDEVEVSLEILIERNKGIEKSTIIVGMLSEINENIEIIKSEHAKPGFSSAFIEEIQPDIMAQFIAIQKFQMALKRSGEKYK